ncbi:MAG: DUF5683 domain-containing protein [Balneolaceae bacterium]|nr:DUF5683 domain-containing protein [Balneolaceae bacterium]
MKWVKRGFTGICVLLIACSQAGAQSPYSEGKEYRLLKKSVYTSSDPFSALMHMQVPDTTDSIETSFPEPKSVMFKSLMIPGWGQIVNRQAWKVPIVYGLFAGVGYYTYYLNGQYQDYRAAYYNSFPDNTDLRFGPTPPRLQGVNRSQLQSNRNSLRNRRDFMAVVFLLAYGLNAVDAYVFAHMRSFDVSDDLSARTVLSPALLADGTPGITLSVSLSTR